MDAELEGAIERAHAYSRSYAERYGRALPKVMLDRKWPHKDDQIIEVDFTPRSGPVARLIPSATGHLR